MSVNEHSAAKWVEGGAETDGEQVESRKKLIAVVYCQDERPFGDGP